MLRFFAKVLLAGFVAALLLLAAEMSVNQLLPTGQAVIGVTDTARAERVVWWHEWGEWGRWWQHDHRYQRYHHRHRDQENYRHRGRYGPPPPRTRHHHGGPPPWAR